MRLLSKTGQNDVVVRMYMNITPALPHMYNGAASVHLWEKILWRNSIMGVYIHVNVTAPPHPALHVQRRHFIGPVQDPSAKGTNVARRHWNHDYRSFSPTKSHKTTTKK